MYNYSSQGFNTDEILSSDLMGILHFPINFLFLVQDLIQEPPFYFVLTSPCLLCPMSDPVLLWPTLWHLNGTGQLFFFGRMSPIWVWQMFLKTRLRFFWGGRQGGAASFLGYPEHESWFLLPRWHEFWSLAGVSTVQLVLIHSSWGGILGLGHYPISHYTLTP